MAESALRQWVEAKGGKVHPGLSLFETDPGPKGRKVVAKQPIQAGEVLVKVPLSLCPVASPTTKANKAAGSDGDGQQSLADFLAGQRKLTPFLRLVLTILHEYSKGDASELKPFLDSLPTSHNCVLGWNNIEKSALRGTTIEEDAAEDIKSVFETIVAPVLRGRPELWQGEWAAFPAFQRVAGVVQSRSFHLQADNWLTGASTESTDLYMIPAIDMVNHSTDPKGRNTSLHRRDETDPAPEAAKAPEAAPAAPERPAPTAPAPEAAAPPPQPAAENGTIVPPPGEQQPAATEQQPAATEQQQPAAAAQPETAAPAAAPVAAETPEPVVTSFFTMEADRDIAAGEELLHTYGDLSDAELLNIFGFIDTLGNPHFTNPHNVVHLPTETLVALCQEQRSGRRLGKNFKRKKDFLADMGLLPEGFPVTAGDPLPDSLVTVTQILLMSDMSEFEDLRLEMQKQKRKGGSLALLGKDTLDEGEPSMFVCTNLLRTVDEHLASFPKVPATLEGADPERCALAAHVRAGEKAIVVAQRKELVKLMMTLDQEGEAEEEDDDSEKIEEEEEE